MKTDTQIEEYWTCRLPEMSGANDGAVGAMDVAKATESDSDAFASQTSSERMEK
jgi:hypothetical protein